VLVVTRFCLILLVVICTVAVANAQSLSIQRKTAREYVKAAAVADSTSQKEGLAGVNFSDPYAPPVGAGKTTAARFPALPIDHPVEPQGGLSLTAGRDAPNEPMTGGLKLRF
jgi:hypothetical protein